MSLIAGLIFNLGVARADFAIQGYGDVRNRTGKYCGRCRIALAKRADGTWYVDMGAGYHMEAGINRAPGQNLKLRRYPWTLLFKRDGVRADYDAQTRTLTFKYKYDSGFLGGGTQVTSGVFTDCQEILDYRASETWVDEESEYATVRR